MVTSLGNYPSNHDLVATHRVRAYSDGILTFLVNRDNDDTKGWAFVCVSGYTET